MSKRRMRWKAPIKDGLAVTTYTFYVDFGMRPVYGVFVLHAVVLFPPYNCYVQTFFSSRAADVVKLIFRSMSTTPLSFDSYFANRVLRM